MWALGLVVLAWIHRMAFLHSNLDRSWGFTIFYEGDSEIFYEYARTILAGQFFDGGIPFHPPLFPLVLSWIHTLVGAGDPTDPVPHLAVKSVMAGLGSLPVGLIYLLVRPYLGHAIALGTSLLCLYSFALYVLSIAPVSETLYLTFIMVGLLLWTRGLEHPWTAGRSGSTTGSMSARSGSTAGRSGPTTGRSGSAAERSGSTTGRSGSTAGHSDPTTGSSGSAAERSGSTTGRSGSTAGHPHRNGPDRSHLTRLALLGLLTGACFGLATLTRAEGALPALLIIAIGGLSALRRRSALLPWIAVIIGFVLVLAPWTVRNARHLARVNESGVLAEPLPTFVPVTAYGPLNFALANHPAATGEFSREALTSGISEAQLDLNDPQHLRFFLDGYDIGTEFILEHPADFLALVGKKWSLYFDALDLGFTQWNAPAGLAGVRRPVDMFVPNRQVLGWILGALALVGSISIWRRDALARRWIGVAAIPIVSGMLTTAFFFGYARLGALILPFVFTGVAAALVGTARALARRRERHPAGRSAEPAAAEFAAARSSASQSSTPSTPPTPRSTPPEDAFAPRRFALRAGIGFAALLLILELWGATGNRNYEATGTQLGGASHLNPHATMHLEVVPRGGTVP